jgi:predicted metalloendopeptidase
MDPSALQRFYDSVSVKPSTFFANALAMDQLEINNMWSALGKPVDREKWDMSVPTVNACESRQSGSDPSNPACQSHRLTLCLRLQPTRQ